MRNFKSYLAEAKGAQFAPWHGTDPDQMKMYIMKADLSRFGWREENFKKLDTPEKLQEKFDEWHKDKENRSISFNKNGSLTFRSSSQTIPSQWCLEEGGRKVIPFQTQSANRLKIWCDALKDVWGLPAKCERLEIRSKQLESLEHLDTQIKETLLLNTPNLQRFDCNVKANYLWFADGVESLANIHKYFTLSKGVGFTLERATTVSPKSNILGLMLIKGGMNQITIGKMRAPDFDNSIVKDFEGAIDIVKDQLESQHDLIDCKEALMNAGYKEYAKL